MLKIRVIPILLWKNIGLVKGIAFNSWRRIGTVMPAIKVYNTRDVDELILLDIAATDEDRDPDYEEIEEIAAECFVPLTIGGGINNIEKIRKLLCVGADKVSINSALYDQPTLINEAAKCFGSQCVVASIDVCKIGDEKYECFSHCGKRPTGKEPGDWAKELESRGAGEIILTSIDRDGTMQGYDNELIKRVSYNVSIPVIGLGGISSVDDALEFMIVGSTAVQVGTATFANPQIMLEIVNDFKKYCVHKGISSLNEVIASI